MSTCLVRIEGVDFATTLYDTDDLSTIRGASQAYLYMPERIGELLERLNVDWTVKLITGGASNGMFRVQTPMDIGAAEVEMAIAEALTAPANGSDPLDAVRPHLSFTWAAVAESGDYGADVYRLAARARARQLQRLTVDVPPTPTALPCELDRRRPGVPDAISVGGIKRRASTSVAARHKYGADQRHQFYLHELGDSVKNLEVTRSLQDIVDARRSDLDKNDRLRLPVALFSKLAVIYLDGNKFTAIREKTVFGDDVPQDKKEKRHRDFSDLVQGRRRDLLDRVMAALRKDERNWVCRDECRRLRFETLLWGGDEALFVLPAWAVMDVLPVLMRVLEGWHWVDGYTLSHAIGVVICNIKTPIAVSRKLAEDIANDTKDIVGKDFRNLANVVSIQVLESVEPPRADLSDFRRKLYGTKAARAFTLVGAAEVDQLLKLIRKFQREPGGLPRSQLYGLIAEARRRDLLQPGMSGEAKMFLEDAETGVVRAFHRAGCEGLLAKLRCEVLGYSEEAPQLPLIRLAELWDYVDPFGAA